jgi:hypothetical protein
LTSMRGSAACHMWQHSGRRPMLAVVTNRHSTSQHVI